MGYRRRRYSTSRRYVDWGSWHAERAREFSEEVGNADEAVKEAFFSLSGKALEYLLDKYEALYGTAAKDYARRTIPKWESNERRMSGMVAERLFGLLPPLMPTDQKHKIVEAIWRSYGPHSTHYLYLGPDAGANAVIGSIEDYFDKLGILHNIPPRLERRFDWLSDNDVSVKQQLLNHFLSEQRKAAVAAAALNVRMMLDAMNADAEGKIFKLSHIVFVGNHKVEIKADPLRSGFLMSASPHNMTRPPIKWNGPLGFAAVIVAGVFLFAWLHGGSATTSGSPQVAAAQSQGVGIQWKSDTQQTHAANRAAPVAFSGNRQRQTVTVAPVGPTAVSRTAAARSVSAIATQPPSAVSAPVRPASGCVDTTIATVEDDGTTVRTATGLSLQISPGGVMRYQAQQWSTGDPVTVCTSTGSDSIMHASIQNPSHFDKVQATLESTALSSALSCNEVRITRVADEGASVETTDGSAYQVSAAGVMRYQVAQWSTGDDVQVCRSGGHVVGVPASIANSAHFDKIQASLVGNGRPATVTCRRTSVSYIGDGGDSIATRDGSTYEVAGLGVMRYQVQQWSTGDVITVCESRASDGSIAAGIGNGGHFDKVQATKS